MKKLFLFSIYVLVFASAGWLSVHKTKPYGTLDSIGKNHPVALEYQQFLNHFQDENYVYILSVSKEPLFEGRKLFELDTFITDQLSGQHGLKRIQTLRNSRRLDYGEKRLQVESFFNESGQLSEEGSKLLKSHPLWKDSLLSEKGTALLSVIELDAANSPEQDKQTLEEVTQLASTISQQFGTENHILGAKIATYDFNKEMKRQQMVITPLAMVLLALFIWWVVGSIEVSLLSFLYMGALYALTSIFIFSFEEGLSPYTQFALLFVFIVALEDFIHLFITYFKFEGRPIERLRLARKEVIWPCFLTSMAEAFGFLGLSLSDIEPVRHFGLYSTLGVVIAFLVCFYWIPWTVDVFNIPLRKNLPSFSWVSQGKSLLNWISPRPGRWALTGIILFVVSLAMLTRLRVDDNLFDKFKADHPLSKALQAFSDNFQFTGGIDISIPGVKSTTFLTRDFESRMGEVTEKIGKLENVSSTRSLSTYLGYLREVFERPSTDTKADFLSDSFLRSTVELIRKMDLLRDYWPRNFDESMMHVRVKSYDVSKVSQTVGQIQSICEESQMPCKLEGFSRLRVAMMNDVVWSFIFSFAFCFVSIFGIFLVLYRSFTWAAIAMFPNILPATVALAGVALFDFPLEDSLILTVSILLGVSVSDTLHLVYGTQQYVKAGATIEKALEKALEHSGAAVMGTNLVLLLILPLFFLSEISVFFRMGFFLIISLILALIADLIFTPALLFFVRPKHDAF